MSHQDDDDDDDEKENESDDEAASFQLDEVYGGRARTTQEGEQLPQGKVVHTDDNGRKIKKRH